MNLELEPETDRIYIEGAAVLTPWWQLDDHVVLIEKGRITVVAPGNTVACPDDARRIDAAGYLLAPGFIDLQINGAFGLDFTADPHTIWSVAQRLPRFGVTAFLPTIVTAPLATVTAAQTTITNRPQSFSGATALGLHLEGPFLNHNKKGAHNPAHLRLPSLPETADWSPESGIKMVTLAPELPHALELVRQFAACGIVVSAGHSTATHREARAGINAGIRYATHLFNAMPTLHHREPGLIGALLADERVTIGFIVDGIHVHPVLAELIWRLLGNGRLNLVTDAMAALGMGDGTYQLGAFQVAVDETGARLANGTLAGAVLSLDTAVRNLISFTGHSLTDILPTVTTTPARLLGLDKQKGEIAAGFDADLVLLTPQHQVAMTICGGRIVYEA